MIKTSADAERSGRCSPPLSELHAGVSSETGVLTDVLLSAPAHLAMIPCNAVTVESLSKGLLTCPIDAVRQHRGLAATLKQAGVRCHFVAPRKGLADMCFTRDPVVMSPWGLIQLRPRMSHRRAEVDHVKAVVQNLGVQLYAHIERGHIEGGDICILRDGLVVVGYSNERTDQLGAEAVGALFAERGWEVVYARFEPEYLHLDTIMTMVAHDCAVVLPDALENTILTKLRALGIKLIIATAQEVRRLSANFLSLGDNRVLAPQHSERLAALLGREGIEVIEVDIDQFTRCGGGPHCLTMPLARRA